MMSVLYGGFCALKFEVYQAIFSGFRIFFKQIGSDYFPQVLTFRKTKIVLVYFLYVYVKYEIHTCLFYISLLLKRIKQLAAATLC
jgi:hypothetical protein